jgi:hypothetical protein
MILIESCTDELGLSPPWGHMWTFIQSRPASHHVSDPFFLAVGDSSCREKHQQGLLPDASKYPRRDPRVHDDGR